MQSFILEDLTTQGEEALSDLVFNVESLHDLRFNTEELLEVLTKTYKYTEEQEEHLMNDLAEEQMDHD